MTNGRFGSVCVVGLGYIGLPTAAMFASRQIRVIGVDVDARVVDTINRGDIHIVEPDLDMVVRAAVTEGFLRAQTAPEPADAFLIAVPTPFRGENRTPDLGYVEAAARAVAPVLRPGSLVILESTSPVGTTEAVAGWLQDARPDLSFPQSHGAASDIRIAHCPERVLPGRVMQELISNDRVIGGVTRACAEAAAELYATFVQGSCTIASTPRAAEMAKLTENSFRDVNIAFANELSLICDRLDIDVWELIALANRHPRVNILQPGPGVGGHCIAVDPWFIVSSAPEDARLIRSAREVNDGKPRWVRARIDAAIADCAAASGAADASAVAVALYGLAFKPNIDDLRESPALEIARSVVSGHPGPVFVVEPQRAEWRAGLARAELADIGAAAAADLHVLLVDHDAFVGRTPESGTIIDTRGIWEVSR